MQTISDPVTLKAAASEARRREAVSFYHQLLEKTDLAQYGNGLQDQLRERGVMFGERLVCPFLRPSFVTREQMDLIRRAVSGVVEAMLVLAPTIVRSETLQRFLGLTDDERRLMEVDPGYPELSTTSRLDSFLIGGTLNFVEYNAECPAGIGYGDVMMDTFLQSSVMKRFVKEYPCQPMFCSDRLLRSLLEAYAKWGGTEAPTLAVIDFDGLPTRHEFEILRRFFVSRGFKALVADPHKLEYKDGYLRHEGTPIHLVYRRLLTNEYLERFNLTHPIFEAYRDHKVCLVNSFRSKFLHKKAIFALLTDPTLQGAMTAEQKRAVAEHVPWTRMLADTKSTGPQGEPIDLLGYARKYRDQMVLKPNDLYGGKGIWVGWEATATEWDGHLHEALTTGDYLLQKRVEIAREHYPVWDGNNVSWGEYAVDLDPYVFDAKAEGILTRLSASSLCNVTAGGGVVPCFILD